MLIDKVERYYSRIAIQILAGVARTDQRNRAAALEASVKLLHRFSSFWKSKNPTDGRDEIGLRHQGKKPWLHHATAGEAR